MCVFDPGVLGVFRFSEFSKIRIVALFFFFSSIVFSPLFLLHFLNSLLFTFFFSSLFYDSLLFGLFLPHSLFYFPILNFSQKIKIFNKKLTQLNKKFPIKLEQPLIHEISKFPLTFEIALF